MTAMINHVFISFSPVQIYDLSYIHLYFFSCSLLRSTASILIRQSLMHSIHVLVSYVDTTVVKFAPDAFQDPYEYFGTDETEASVQLLSNYMVGRAGSEKYFKLRGGIRDTVIATWKAEDLWLNGKTELTQYVISRYIGTADGVFRGYPGAVMSRGYDPRRRPWYVT